jgi:hypothetical protein
MLQAEVIAMDYDRTIAEEQLGFMIDSDVKEALRCLGRLNRFKLILATGRCLRDIPDRDVFEIFDIIVSENGTVIFRKGSEMKLVGQEWLLERALLVGFLDRMAVEYTAGEVIIGSRISNLEKFREAVSLAGLAGSVSFEYNREGLMVMPQGWNKGRGVSVALKEFGGGRLMAIGDSLNDISMFSIADIRVAARNADPELKQIADYVCPLDGGKGVIEFLLNIDGAGGALSECRLGGASSKNG